MVRPTLRDVLLLLALQVGLGLAIAAIVDLLPVTTRAQNWTTVIGLMVGTQVFATIKERRRPGTVGSPGFGHHLALRATVGQLLLAALFGAFAKIVWPDEVDATVAQLGWGLIGIIACIAVLLCYGVTRAGLSTVLRSLARVKAAAARRTQPPTATP